MKSTWIVFVLIIGAAGWHADAQAPAQKRTPTRQVTPAPPPAAAPARPPDFLADANAQLRMAIRTRWVAASRGEGGQFYAEDAALLPPNGQRVNGRAAIEEFWRRMVGDGLQEMKLLPQGTSRLEGHDRVGAMAIESGSYEFTWMKTGQPAFRDTGKYLAGLIRDDEGNWRVIYDIFNSDLSPGPPSK